MIVYLRHLIWLPLIRHFKISQLFPDFPNTLVFHTLFMDPKLFICDGYL